MIISRTPLRVSFFGGGTDLKEFYEAEGGAVLSTAIDKYIFVTVNKKFDEQVRVSYSKTEIVERADEIKHDLVRTALKFMGVERGIEITTIADIPSQGTGLGSSSTFTVGLLHALYAYKNKHVSAQTLAQDACRIEIELLREPIGKQDQYIAAYGGLQFIQFNQDGTVFIDPVICDNGVKARLQDSLMLFYTGITRRSSAILTEQKANSNGSRLKELKAIKELALKAKKIIESGKSLDQFGALLDESWQIKKSLASGISNPEIEEYYNGAKRAGAAGGKIAGAGGGGFLLLYVDPSKQNQVREALSGLQETPFALEPQGSKIIYVCD